MSPQIVELTGFSGLDFVIVAMEVESMDPSMMENLLRAASGRCVPMVKLRRNDPNLVSDALNAGAPFIMLPHVRGRRDLEAAIAASRFPPHGVRALCPIGRFGGYGALPLDGLIRDAEEHTPIIPIIEDKEVLDHLDEVMSNPHCDIYEIGPFDLSASLGVSPQRSYNNPETLAAIDRICEAADKHGKALLAPTWFIPTSSNEELLEFQVRQLVSRGIRVIYHGADVMLLDRTWREMLPLRDAAPSTERVPGTEVSRVSQRALAASSKFLSFVTSSTWSKKGAGNPDASDFVFGNPHEMPLPAVSDALTKWTAPRNKDWYAYKTSEPQPRAAVAEGLRRRSGVAYEDEDVFLTNGAFAGIAVSLRAVADPGDEILFTSPAWFFYEPIIHAICATPVSMKARPVTFDLDLEAIAARIGPRTRAILVNSPNNPTGRIYDEAQLRKLGEILEAASRKWNRRIYLLSDEAYNRIVFDGKPFISPTRFYSHSILIYTYGKQLLTPGERVGYIALPPTMPDRGALRDALIVSQFTTGWAFPNAILQCALAELDDVSIDVGHLEKKRDRIVSSLRGYGYELNSPEGTFYLMVKSPWEDDVAFSEHLAARNVFIMPGALVETPGYFRISLTANDQMIERALPVFAEAIRAPRTAVG